MKNLKNSLKRYILKLKVKKENLVFRYQNFVYKIFLKQNSFVLFFFEKIEKVYSKKFNPATLKLDRGVYNLKEIGRLFTFTLISLITNFILGLLNFITLLAVIETDLLINGFFVYKNPFFNKLVKDFIKIFFLSNLVYFIPLKYNLILILYYISFYVFIITFLLVKRQNQECFEFVGSLFLKQKHKAILQVDFNSKLFFFVINLIRMKNQWRKKNNEILAKKLQELEEQINGNKKN